LVVFFTSRASARSAIRSCCHHGGSALRVHGCLGSERPPFPLSLLMRCLLFCIRRCLLYPPFDSVVPLSAVQSDHARVWDWRSQGSGLSLALAMNVAIGAFHHLKCICEDLRVICFRRIFILEVDFWSSGFGIDARRGFGVLCNVAFERHSIRWNAFQGFVNDLLLFHFDFWSRGCLVRVWDWCSQGFRSPLHFAMWRWVHSVS